jgi:uncharacterized membrane protein YjjP (DUF1212 family)
VLDLVLQAASILFANGQTTQRTEHAAKRCAASLGYRADVFPRWGELTVRLWDGDTPHDATEAVAPANVDIGKVSAVLETIDAVADGRLDADSAGIAVAAIGRSPPASTPRFAIMAGAGAAALGIIFGASHLLSLVLIACSGGAGAYLRRGLARLTHNPFVQPFSAALLAGLVGAVVVHFQLSSAQRLIAVCPAMVLVPGPHLLNGAIDLVRARIPLGAWRLLYAGLIVLAICMGLLMGMAAGGASLPPTAPSSPVPLRCDVIAAGVAVAAYGTFFSMPWRMLPIPMAIGMLAHAARWGAISVAGWSVEAAAFVACVIVSVLVTPIADRMRLPFAGFAFAAVVSLIPGVFLFRLSSGLAELLAVGAKAPAGLLEEVIADGVTAFGIMLAMVFGLIVPKLCIEHFWPGLTTAKREAG